MANQTRRTPGTSPIDGVPVFPEPHTTEGKNLTDKEREQLENEYEQLCQDWRWRDKYVLDKLTGSGILFTLLALAIGNMHVHSVFRPFVFLAGILFSIISSISVYKDVVFRNGTEKAIIRIAKELGIENAFNKLEDLQPIDDGLIFKDIKTTRKIQPAIDYSDDVNILGIRFGFLKKWMYKRATFNWIFSFYFFSTAVMSGFFIVSIFDYFLKWGLFG